MTLGEKRLWAELRQLKLHIRRQAPIGRFIADFAHHASRTVIEVDSPWHDSDDAQLRDAERDAWLNGQGYQVLRVRDGDVLNDARRVAERIARDIAVRLPPGRRWERSDPASLGADADVRLTPRHLASTPTPAPPPLRGRGSDR